MYGDHPGEMLAAGDSSLGILSALILGVVGIVILFGIGWLRLKGDMVLVGSCSAAIAASCQTTEGRETSYRSHYAESIWTKEMSWGELDYRGTKMLGFGGYGTVRPPTEGVGYL